LAKKNQHEAAVKKAKKLGFADADCTIILCTDEKAANCAKASQMKSSLKHLRKRAKQLREETGQRVVVVPSKCLKICKGGPLAGVHPGGIWYGGCDEATLDRVLDAHCGEASPPTDKLIASPEG